MRNSISILLVALSISVLSCEKEETQEVSSTEESSVVRPDITGDWKVAGTVKINCSTGKQGEFHPYSGCEYDNGYFRIEKDGKFMREVYFQGGTWFDGPLPCELDRVEEGTWEWSHGTSMDASISWSNGEYYYEGTRYYRNITIIDSDTFSTHSYDCENSEVDFYDIRIYKRI